MPPSDCPSGRPSLRGKLRPPWAPFKAGSGAASLCQGSGRDRSPSARPSARGRVCQRLPRRRRLLLPGLAPSGAASFPRVFTLGRALSDWPRRPVCRGSVPFAAASFPLVLCPGRAPSEVVDVAPVRFVPQERPRPLAHWVPSHGRFLSPVAPLAGPASFRVRRVSLLSDPFARGPCGQAMLGWSCVPQSPPRGARLSRR